MPLPAAAAALLDQFRQHSGDYQIVGLIINPVSGELGVFSSESYAPGAAIGFIQNGVAMLVGAMSDGTLEVADATNEGGEEPAQASHGSAGLAAAAVGGKYVH